MRTNALTVTAFGQVIVFGALDIKFEIWIFTLCVGLAAHIFAGAAANLGIKFTAKARQVAVGRAIIISRAGETHTALINALHAVAQIFTIAVTSADLGKTGAGTVGRAIMVGSATFGGFTISRLGGHRALPFLATIVDTITGWAIGTSCTRLITIYSRITAIAAGHGPNRKCNSQNKNMNSFQQTTPCRTDPASSLVDMPLCQ